MASRLAQAFHAFKGFMCAGRPGTMVHRIERGRSLARGIGVIHVGMRSAAGPSLFVRRSSPSMLVRLPARSRHGPDADDHRVHDLPSIRRAGKTGAIV